MEVSVKAGGGGRSIPFSQKKMQVFFKRIVLKKKKNKTEKFPLTSDGGGGVNDVFFYFLPLSYLYNFSLNFNKQTLKHFISWIINYNISSLNMYSTNKFLISFFSVYSYTEILL